MVHIRRRRRRAGGRDEPVDRGAPVRVRGPPLHDLPGHGDLDPLEGTPQPTDEAHRRRQPVITVTPRRLPERLLRRRGRHRQPVQHRAPNLSRDALRSAFPGAALGEGVPPAALPGGILRSGVRGGILHGCGVTGCMLRGGVPGCMLRGGVPR